MRKTFIPPQVNTTGLIAYYKLWAGLTTTALVFDYSLGGHDGTVASAPPPSFPGFDFDGGADYITVADHADFDLTTVLSVFAWAKNDNAAIASAEDFIGKSDQNGDKREWFMQLTTAEKFRLVISSDGTAADRFDVLTDDAITVDSWHLYGFTFDNDTIILCVDGVAVASTENNTGSGGINNDISPIAIGATYTNSGIPTLGGFWDGLIDDVMIFNRALSAPEVKSIHEVTRWRYGA